MINKEVRHIDITHTPELLRLAEEIQQSNQPTILTKDGEAVLEVKPVKPKRQAKRSKTRAYEAFLSSAGSWAGIVDTDQLIQDIYESRRTSSRPPVNL